MSQPTRTEVLVRAVGDVLSPMVKQLTDLGYDARLVAHEDERTVRMHVEVLITEKTTP